MPDEPIDYIEVTKKAQKRARAKHEPTGILDSWRSVYDLTLAEATSMISGFLADELRSAIPE
jgi:hypothetical protein